MLKKRIFLLVFPQCPAQKMTPMFDSSGFLDRDMKPERFQLPDVTMHGSLAMAPIEVVGAQFLVRDAVAHDVVRDFQDLVAHRDDRFLVPAMPFDAVIPRLQRASLGAHRAEAGLDQRAAQIGIPFPRFPAPPLPGTLVLAGAHRAPAAQMAGGRKRLHVAAGFREDANRADPIHARNRIQPCQRPNERSLPR